MLQIVMWLTTENKPPHKYLRINLLEPGW